MWEASSFRRMRTITKCLHSQRISKFWQSKWRLRHNKAKPTARAECLNLSFRFFSASYLSYFVGADGKQARHTLVNHRRVLRRPSNLLRQGRAQKTAHVRTDQAVSCFSPTRAHLPIAFDYRRKNSLPTNSAMMSQ